MKHSRVEPVLRRVWMAALLLAAIRLTGMTGLALAQQSSWTYDIFVNECRKAGGMVGSTREQYMRGERFICDRSGGGGQSRGGNDRVCAEAKINIDWVLFSDRGAYARFSQARGRGFSPLDAIIFAQSHNGNAQQTIMNCKDWATSYLGGIPAAGAGGPSNGVTLSNRSLGPSDCRCVTVLPTDEVDFGGRRAYRVSNSCDGLEISVQFIEKVPDRSMSSASPFSLLGSGAETKIWAPAYKLASISGFSMRNVASSFTCRTD